MVVGLTKRIHKRHSRDASRDVRQSLTLTAVADKHEMYGHTSFIGDSRRVDDILKPLFHTHIAGVHSQCDVCGPPQ